MPKEWGQVVRFLPVYIQIALSHCEDTRAVGAIHLPFFRVMSRRWRQTVLDAVADRRTTLKIDFTILFVTFVCCLIVLAWLYRTLDQAAAGIGEVMAQTAAEAVRDEATRAALLMTLEVFATLAAAILIETALFAGLGILEEAAIPSVGWGASWRLVRAEHRRRVTWPSVLAVLPILPFAGLLAFRDLTAKSSGGISEETLAIVQLLIFIGGGTLFAIDLIAAMRFGYLRFIEESAPSRRSQINVVLFDFARVAISILFVIVLTFLIGEHLPDRVVLHSQAMHARLIERAEQMADAPEEASRRASERLRAAARRLPFERSQLQTLFNPVLDMGRRTMAILILIGLVTSVFVPLFHLQVRNPLFFFILLLAVSVPMERVIGVVLELLAMPLSGTAATVVWVGLSLAIGTLLAEILVRPFGRNARCWHCGEPLEERTKFCASCGSRAASVSLASAPLLANGKSGVVHRQSCRSIRRADPASLRAVASMREAREAGLKGCQICAPGVD